MSVIISVATQKGGVGKTTTAVNLARALTLEPFYRRVLVVDVDPQANASIILSVAPERSGCPVAKLFSSDSSVTFAQVIAPSKYRGLDVITSDISLFEVGRNLSNRPEAILGMRGKLDEQTLGRYDFIIIDCPPNLGGPFLVNSLVISDYVIIPVDSGSIFATAGMEEFIKSVEELRQYASGKMKLLGILITQYDSRARAARKIAELLETRYGDLLFTTRISQAATIQQANIAGQTVIDFAKKSRGTGDYYGLAAEVCERCNVQCPDLKEFKAELFAMEDQTEAIPRKKIKNSKLVRTTAKNGQTQAELKDGINQN